MRIPAKALCMCLSTVNGIHKSIHMVSRLRSIALAKCARYHIRPIRETIQACREL